MKRDFANSAGSKWLVYYPAYVWLLPLWLFGSVLSPPTHEFSDSFLVLLIINIAALALCTVVFVLFTHTLWRRSLQDKEPGTALWAVILGGGMLGLVKGVSTFYLSHLFLDINNVSAFARIFASCALGIGVVLVVPITLSKLETYRAERLLLIGELVRTELEKHNNAAPSHNKETSEKGEAAVTANDELNVFVQQSLARLQKAKRNPQQLPDVLDYIRQKEIRPLSHRIWRRENDRIPDFTLTNLVNVSVTRLNFVIIPVLAWFTLVVGPSLVLGYGIGPGLLALGIDLLCMTGVLSIVRLIPPKTPRWGWGVYLMSTFVTTTLIMVANTLMVGQIPTQTSVQSALSIWLTSVALFLGTGVYNFARKTHNDISEDLMRLRPDIATFSIENAAKARADRELAQLLHSQVQNVFLAQSVELKSKLQNFEGDVLAQNAVLDRSFVEIERYLHGLLNKDLQKVFSFQEDEWLTPFYECWSPVLDITFRGVLSEPQRVPHKTRKTILDIMSEATANALRHGLAKKIECDVVLSHDSITAIVDDDGLGPRHGIAGLGSYVFSSIPHSQWKLVSSPVLSGARLEVSWSIPGKD